MLLCDLVADTCELYAEKWTWQVLVIAFCASAVAGIVVILILVYACFNRGGGNISDKFELDDR